eukprot:TRINITY_DN41088_c0_g1_i1.p1 TRINITY_DN41088_c0_g1~~TRINITY_DN41088_c0_g1_i1.p1  ORF type:complete len:477 (-),score=76.41 TRINITY_DN41088_c0_g1_i1:163-1557(-)
MDGTQCRVASFWAIIRSSSVDLYRMTAAFIPHADDPDAELAKFLEATFSIEVPEDDHYGRSARLLEIFKQVYDAVAAVRAPRHGLVYVGHGNGDGAMFESMLVQADSRKLLSYANSVLGRRVDFLDFSGNCNEGSLSNIANLGAYCNYMVASEFQVAGFEDSEVAENGGLFTDASLRRYYLMQPEYCYHLFDLPGRSVLDALVARVRGMEENWKFCDASIKAAGACQSLSIYCTKALPEFLEAGGSVLAADESCGDRLAASRVEVGEGVFYDVKTLLGEELQDHFSNLCVHYRHTGDDSEWPGVNGMFTAPAAVLKWRAGYDGLDDESRLDRFRADPPYDFMVSEPWEKGILPGFTSEEAMPYGDEPHFPDVPASASMAPPSFCISDNAYNSYCNVKGDCTAGLRQGSRVRMSGQEAVLKVDCCQYFPDDDSTYVQFDVEHGAADGDSFVIVFEPPVSIARHEV